MTNKDFIRELSYEIDLLKQLRDANEGKETYVVANETYVHVREGYGLNDTDFRVISPCMARMVSIFYSIKDAEERGMDYHLIDGAGRKVELEIISASLFYTVLIAMTENMIKQLTLSTE